MQHEEDQDLYVLEGEHELVCDGRAFSGSAGAFVYVPRGTVHSFSNVGTTPGRILVLSTPAGGTEDFFFEVAEPAEGGSPPPDSEPPDVGTLREIARRHGSSIDTMALLRQLGAEDSREQGT